MTGSPAVVVEDLHVSFGEAHALAGVDFTVARGMTLGVLGPNGAGKTTLVRVLTTLARPTAGRAVVDGFDVRDEAAEVRRRIGVTGQYAGLDEFLTGHENLEEVDRLADQIVVLDQGRIAARGTPHELKRLVGGKAVTATVAAEHLGRLDDVFAHLTLTGARS